MLLRGQRAPARESASTITPALTRLTKAQNLLRFSGCFSRLQLPLVAMVLAASMGK